MTGRSTPFTCYASAARVASPTTMTGVANKIGATGIVVFINVTVVDATPSVVFTLEGQDPLSGTWYTILASAAVTATGLTILRVYPGATAAANLVADDVLPAKWRVKAVHGDADSITYSVGALTF